MTDGLPPIKGFLPTSLIEWEGRLCCAVFLPGCNFRCPFCHASDLVLHGAELDEIPLSEVLAHLDGNDGWLDGIEVSGGEATLHPGLAGLITMLREHVPGVKLDTNGSNPDVLRDLVERRLLDFVSMDVKAPFDERYAQAAGVAVDLPAVGASIDILRSTGIDHEFRITVVPGLHEARDVVEVARHLGQGERLILQQFAPLNCLDPAFEERKPYSRDDLREMATAASEYVAECKLRGDVTAGVAER